MSTKTTAVSLETLLTPERLKDVDSWIAKYPEDQKQSAVMSALRIVQEQYGHLTTEYMDAVAVYLGMPAIAVYEVATFYTMYEKKPVGRHVINVCTNISCQLCGCGKIVDSLEKKLKIKLGQTTKDERFTLRGVECLAACANAPVMQVDKNYHEKLTPETLDTILDSYE